MPSPILARADALMQRRRSTTDVDDVPVLTDAVDLADSDDDIPVLLDVEAVAPLLPADEAVPPEIAPDDAGELPDAMDEALIEDDFLASEPAAKEPALSSDAALARADIAHEIARRVELRLAAELPNLIAAAVRDYLAEQPEHAGERDAN